MLEKLITCFQKTWMGTSPSDTHPQPHQFLFRIAGPFISFINFWPHPPAIWNCIQMFPPIQISANTNSHLSYLYAPQLATSVNIMLLYSWWKSLLAFHPCLHQLNGDQYWSWNHFYVGTTPFFIIWCILI